MEKDYLNNCDCFGLGMPKIGEKFPDVKLQTTHGALTPTKHFKGKWFVLFSHPADFTPVCTTEFVGFAKKHEEFKKLNTELIGISIDQVFSHIKWMEWIKENMKIEIKFPIIADNGDFADMLGMVHPDKGVNTVRAVFIVDDQGLIRAILYYPQEIGRNIDEIIRMVKAFQVSESQKVAMPENWPNNEFMKDRVIIPPATDVKTAEKRKDEYDCYDWWFCHKDLGKD